jgi:hypothetical protein
MILTYHQDNGRIIDVPYSRSQKGGPKTVMGVSIRLKSSVDTAYEKDRLQSQPKSRKQDGLLSSIVELYAI